jgi:hypothetical protein
MTTSAEIVTTNELRIDFLFLDLTTCDRCLGADRNLESALEVVRYLLAANGTEIEINKVHVESADQARELRFVSSPTIRVNGSDVALELRESSCGCEACTDGCGEGIACRVWVHRGREHTEPPVAMIVDAIMREVYGGEVVSPELEAQHYELPENLERFFATACCPPAEQRSCCDPEDKLDCCGASSGEGCGCR